MKWFSKRRANEPGWLAVSLQSDNLSFAHGRYASNGKSTISRCGTRALAGDFDGAGRIAKELQFDRYQCSTLLAPGEYQLLLVEAPNVQPGELKTAIRWRVKDLLDYHADDATIDVLDIPPDPSGGARAHSMYAVAARNDVIQGCIGRFESARIPLSVIEIPETAQRNVAALFEPENRGLALLYLGPAHGLLTINFHGELYLARRIEVGMDQIVGASGERRDEAMNRVALELQRTFDHFDRQFPFVAVAKLLLGPEPENTGLAEHLKRNLDLPVEEAKLGAVLGFGADAALDRTAEWRLFHLLGAVLRNETKAL
jgi:MSHA biogenesis protein MshI